MQGAWNAVTHPVQTAKNTYNAVVAGASSFVADPMEYAQQKVVNTFVRETSDTVTVRTSDEEIVTTREHPFRVESEGWVPAVNLSAGDKLGSTTGETVYVESVTVLELEESVKVYNFEVEDTHNYFVGIWCVLVHNACSGNVPKLKQFYNSIKDAPLYPEAFEAVKGGTRKVNINNSQVLEGLREVESGKWMKFYKDGYDADGNKISIHYFQSESGKVFDVKVKPSWSND